MKEKLSEKLMKVFYFIFVFGMSSIILYISFKDFNWTFVNLLQILLKDTLWIVIALFFIGLVIYEIKLTTVKKKVVCKLKNIIDLRNIDDPYSFELQFEYQNRTYTYNIKETTHPYIIGNNYIVLIRNYIILNILSDTMQEVDNKDNYWHSTYMPDGSYVPFNLLIIFYLFAFAFLMGSIVILINILINNLEGKELTNNIIPFIICFIIFIVCTWCIYNDFQKKKERDNNNEE